MELLMNEQTMKIITAGAMAYAAYRGIKKIEKVFNNRATERERIIELQLKEEERRLAKEERKRISSYFNITRERYEGSENRDHWYDDRGKVKFLKLDMMNIANKNAMKAGV